MQEGLVTVTIPVFNGETTISRAIDSVRAQTYKQWELIIIDDASTDKTFDILRKYQKLDGRIRIFRNKLNRGTYYNRNRAILFAKGEFITNLDADDSFEPQKLAVQVEQLGSANIACICLHRRKKADGEESVAFTSNTLLFKKSIVEFVGYFDSVRYDADTEYFNRIKSYYPILQIRTVLYNYTISENSLSESKETGVKSKIGSERRAIYEANYSNWHKNTVAPYLTFPQIKRVFPLGHSSQACPKEKITVSIATFPARIEFLRKALHSIYPWVDQINVFLNEYTSIPPFLLKHPKINPILADYDRGDTGKFFWSETIQGYHFTCDDDIIYTQQYFETLLLTIEKYNRTAIVGLHGSTLEDNHLDFYSKQHRKVIHLRRKLSKDKKVQFLGTGAMAYHTDKIQIPLHIFTELNMADVFVGVYAQRKNIPLVRCASKIGLADTCDLDDGNSIYKHSIADKPTKFNRKAFVNAYLAEHWNNYAVNDI